MGRSDCVGVRTGGEAPAWLNRVTGDVYVSDDLMASNWLIKWELAAGDTSFLLV